MKQLSFLLTLLIACICIPFTNKAQTSEPCCTDTRHVSGPTSITVGQTATYTTDLVVGGILPETGQTIIALDWNVTGAATIVGNDLGTSIKATATGEGTFCVQLYVHLKDQQCAVIRCLPVKCDPRPDCCKIGYAKEDCPVVTYFFYLEECDNPKIVTATWTVQPAKSDCQPYGTIEFTSTGLDLYLDQGGSNIPNTVTEGWKIICAKLMDADSNVICTVCRCVYIEVCDDGSYEPGRLLKFDDTTVYLDEMVQNGSYTVYAMDGRIAQTGQITAAKTIDIQPLVNGIYVIHINDGKRERSQKIFINRD